MTELVGEGWRYAGGGKRDLRLDLLRGFAVFAMVVDHIGGTSWLYPITGGNGFFVSAAEAFVLISGVTVGIVYGEKVRVAGLRAATVKLVQRSWTLYVLSIWLAIACIALGWLFDSRLFGELGDRAKISFEVVTLQRAFPFVDVILLYCILMLLAPMGLALLRQGRWRLLASLSWGLWAAYQMWPDRLMAPWLVVQGGQFPVAAWQVLFFSGLILGHERARISQSTLGRSRRLWEHYGTTAALCALSVAIWGAMIWHAATPTEPLSPWFRKSDLSPLRLVACILVFWLAWEMVTRLWRPLFAWVGPLLLPLGQGALYAYSAHVLILAPAGAIVAWSLTMAGPDAAPITTLSINAVIQAGVVFVVWSLTRARYLSPALSSLGQPPVLRWRPGPDSHVLWWRPGASLVSVVLGALGSKLLGG